MPKSDIKFQNVHKKPTKNRKIAPSHTFPTNQLKILQRFIPQKGFFATTLLSRFYVFYISANRDTMSNFKLFRIITPSPPVFDKRESLLYHLQFHQLPGQAPPPPPQPQQQQYHQGNAQHQEQVGTNWIGRYLFTTSWVLSGRHSSCKVRNMFAFKC